jgi:hypothetical protein
MSIVMVAVRNGVVLGWAWQSNGVTPSVTTCAVEPSAN